MPLNNTTSNAICFVYHLSIIPCPPKNEKADNTSVLVLLYIHLTQPHIHNTSSTSASSTLTSHLTVHQCKHTVNIAILSVHSAR